MELPFLCDALNPSTAVLLRMHPSSGQALEDVSSHLRFQKRPSTNYHALFIEGLSAGTYRLHLPQSETQLDLLVHRGVYWGEDASFIQIRDRILENKQKPSFLKIANLTATADSVRLVLEGGSSTARVHLFAFHFLPKDLESFVWGLRRTLGESFSKANFPFAMWKNFFLSNRALGDEYRYVFDRKNLPRFVGNTLEKPKLLVKRNYIRDTTMA